jgi:hypothetical protein
VLTITDPYSFEDWRTAVLGLLKSPVFQTTAQSSSIAAGWPLLRHSSPTP